MKSNPLTFEFIGNACGIFTGNKGTRIFCDPWLVDGVFEGNWCHYPPLESKIDDFLDVEAIYISHLHPDHMKDYIKNTLAAIIYPYEKENEPDPKMLISNLQKVSDGILSRMQRFGITSDYKVITGVYGDQYQIYPSFKKYIRKDMHKTLLCSLDPRLLNRIVNKTSNWNNAEVGAHINYVRIPNIFQPDLHTGLQFFHI